MRNEASEVIGLKNEASKVIGLRNEASEVTGLRNEVRPARRGVTVLNDRWRGTSDLDILRMT